MANVKLESKEIPDCGIARNFKSQSDVFPLTGISVGIAGLQSQDQGLIEPAMGSFSQRDQCMFFSLNWRSHGVVDNVPGMPKHFSGDHVEYSGTDLSGRTIHPQTS